ncbi:TMEM175 family protein [Streptomyces pinistramenti]|uniref:TMEM175 family protein n=1 Tax=Streptomyces pinistramenti TaxID=2884812 RepID=UPI001D05D5C7|nr:TMEM175 family protein [Streptomyces pinistramenti]MCB5905915.1 TMEM175 family protein [Streptomyces pinistramenti]
MGASGVIDETETGGADPAESSVPSDRVEGGVSGERLVLFTDAVTAISITLLVLPLVDLVPEVASAHEDASEVITGHLSQLWSFLLSFAVIANIWREHHRAFSSVTMLTRSLTAWNMGWLLSVVVLPLPTEMIGAFGGHDRFVGAFYYSTLLAGMVCRLAMLRILKTTPGLVEGDGEEGRRRIEGLYTESYLNVLAVAIALVIALAVPVLQYYSLLLLPVLPRLERLRRRRSAR